MASTESAWQTTDAYIQGWTFNQSGFCVPPPLTLLPYQPNLQPINRLGTPVIIGTDTIRRLLQYALAEVGAAEQGDGWVKAGRIRGYECHFRDTVENAVSLAQNCRRSAPVIYLFEGPAEHEIYCTIL